MLSRQVCGCECVVHVLCLPSWPHFRRRWKFRLRAVHQRDVCSQRWYDSLYVVYLLLRRYSHSFLVRSCVACRSAVSSRCTGMLTFFRFRTHATACALYQAQRARRGHLRRTAASTRATSASPAHSALRSQDVRRALRNTTHQTMEWRNAGNVRKECLIFIWGSLCAHSVRRSGSRAPMAALLFGGKCGTTLHRNAT